MSTSTCNALRAAELAGCTYRQLDHWCRRGFVTPHRPARGTGSRREFTIDDVRLVWALAQVLPEQRPAVFAALAEHPDAELLMVGARQAWVIEPGMTIGDMPGLHADTLVGVLSMQGAPQLAAA